MFTKTPKLSPIQQQLKEQLQCSHNKALCYLEMYQSSQTKIPTINLTQYIHHQQLKSIYSELFQKYYHENIRPCLTYCVKIFVSTEQLKQNQEKMKDSFLFLICYIILSVLTYYTILYINPSTWLSKNPTTCRYVGYLLGQQVDETSLKSFVSRLSWQGYRLFSINTVLLGIIVVPLGKSMITFAIMIVNLLVTFVTSWRLVRRLKAHIQDFVSEELNMAGIDTRLK